MAGRACLILQASVIVAVGVGAGWLHMQRADDAVGEIDRSIARAVAREARPQAEGPTGPEFVGDPADSGTPETTPADPADPTALPFEITSAQARPLYEQGIADFIDARLKEDFEAGHIPGAFSMPPRSFNATEPPAIQAGLIAPDESRVVIVYCEGGDCDASHIVAERLAELNFPRIHIMVDGFPGWEAEVGETETGPGGHADFLREMGFTDG